jgi:hypothetical protein
MDDHYSFPIEKHLFGGTPPFSDTSIPLFFYSPLSAAQRCCSDTSPMHTVCGFSPHSFSRSQQTLLIVTVSFF